MDNSLRLATHQEPEQAMILHGAGEWGYLPMEDPGATLISLGNVVLGKQPRAASGQRGAINPALTGAGLFHGRHEDEVPWDQLQLVIILR